MKTIHNGIEVYGEEFDYLSDDEGENKSTFFKNFFQEGENIEDLIDSLDEDIGVDVLDKHDIGFEDVSIETDEELEDEDEQELIDGFTEFLISKGGGKDMILKDVDIDDDIEDDSDEIPVTDSEEEDLEEEEEEEEDGYDDDHDLDDDDEDPPYRYQRNYRDTLGN